MMTQIEIDRTTHSLNEREFEVVMTWLSAAGQEEDAIAKRLLGERIEQRSALLDELKSGASRIMQCTVCGARHKVST